MLLRPETVYTKLDKTRAGEFQRKEEMAQLSEVNPHPQSDLCQKTCLNYFTNNWRVDMSRFKKSIETYSLPVNHRII